MRDNGYCREYLMSYYRELRWIKANAEKYNVSSYEELCKIRLQSTKPYKISHTKSMYGTFKRFEEDGEFPDRKRHQPLVKKATYHKLSPYYKEIIDLYTEYAQDNVHSENTISKCRSKASCFFFHLQNLGYETLDEVKEKDVLSFFTDKDGENIRSRSYKRDIVMVLKSDLREFSTSAHRVSELLPAIPKRHKNIPFLNEEESTAIHEMLSNDDCPLSLRDRAIGMLLYFTGIRAGDIVDLRLSEIDWRNDIIIRQQRKTGKANTLNIVGWKHGFASYGRKRMAMLLVRQPMNYDITMQPSISTAGILTVSISATNCYILRNQWGIDGRIQRYTTIPSFLGLQIRLRKHQKTDLTIL